MTTREWAHWPDDIHMRAWLVFPGDVRKWTSYVKAFQSSDRHTDRQVTRGHFRSRERDKDGGRTIRTIRSAVVENPMTRKPDDFIFYRTGVMDNRSLHCGNRHFGRIHYSAPVTLTLTQLPSYTNLTRIAWRYTLDVQIWTSYVKAFESYRLTDRQNRPKL